MQEKGAVLARARAAAEVAKRAHYYEGQQNELNGILSEMAEHERQRAIAIEQGDRDREEAQRALILMCARSAAFAKVLPMRRNASLTRLFPMAGSRLAKKRVP